MQWWQRWPPQPAELSPTWADWPKSPPILRLLFLSPFKRGRMFQRSTHKAMAVGAGAIPVVSLISFFVGVIIALQ